MNGRYWWFIVIAGLIVGAVLFFRSEKGAEVIGAVDEFSDGITGLQAVEAQDDVIFKLDEVQQLQNDRMQQFEDH